MSESGTSHADKRSDAQLTVIGILYVLTLSLVVASAGSFFVVALPDALMVVGMSTLPILIAAHLIRKNQGGIVFALLHFYFAILFHPHVALKDPVYMDYAEQVETLQRIDRGTGNESVDAQLTYHLGESLEADAVLRFSVNHPVASWLYPPSVALAVWGGVFFFLLRKRASAVLR